VECQKFIHLVQHFEHKFQILLAMLLNFGWLNHNLLLLIYLMLWILQNPTLNIVLIDYFLQILTTLGFYKAQQIKKILLIEQKINYQSSKGYLILMQLLYSKKY
jgi:hypothetical protein